MRRIAETAVPRLGEVCATPFIPEPGATAEVVGLPRMRGAPLG